MPAQERSHLPMFLVLWEATGVADRTGKPKVSAVPVERNCRQLSARRDTRDKEGNIITLDASAVVEVDFKVNSVVWFGRLADFNPAIENDLMEVIYFDKTPDLKGRDFYREIGLMRYKHSLPS